MTYHTMSLFMNQKTKMQKQCQKLNTLLQHPRELRGYAISYQGVFPRRKHTLICKTLKIKELYFLL